MAKKLISEPPAESGQVFEGEIVEQAQEPAHIEWSYGDVGPVLPATQLIDLSEN